LHKHDQNMRQSCGNLIGRNGCNSKIIDWVGKPRKGCLFRCFLASLCRAGSLLK
jgi:hypothetical protein